MTPQVQTYNNASAANGAGYAYYAPPEYNYSYNEHASGHAYATCMSPPPMYDHEPTGKSTMDQGAPGTDDSAATYPAVESISVHNNDVLMGRGGKNNQHTGNERLRDMARAVRDQYKASAKKGKSNMSRDLVQQVRDLKPPGRFLKRNPVTNEWEDVGDDIAREKVSQVLRDAVSEWTGPKAAAAAAKQQEEQKGEQDYDESGKQQRAKPTMLPPLPPPPPEIVASKDMNDKHAVAAATTATTPKPSPVSLNAAVDNKAVKVVNKETKEALPGHTTTAVDADTTTTLEIPSIQDDLDYLPPDSDVNPLMPNDPFPAMLDESLVDNMGRDRFLSDMSFNDTASGGEFMEEHKLEDPSIDDGVNASSGVIQPLRIRLDTDNSLDDASNSAPNETTTLPISAPTNSSNKRQPSLRVPVPAVPWSRNKRKTNLLGRYAHMNMGLSSSDMSISSIGSQQLSSRNLGTQLSSRQLMSTGVRQMSSRQLSSRQLSSRQLSSRQLSGRQLMSMDRRKQNFALMGESDLSLDALSISGDTHRSLSRKNIFMDQYLSMDMGLSDFSLGSMAGEPMHAGNDVQSNGVHYQRPSIIIEGDLEELSEHGSSHHLRKLSNHGGNNNGAGGLQQTFTDTYNAVGMGTSISNMTVNTIGTFTGHSRRGFFASTGNSMRIESGHSFMTMGDLQLDMLDDDLFDEFGTDAVEEEEKEEEFGTMDENYDESDNEFATEFC